MSAALWAAGVVLFLAGLLLLAGRDGFLKQQVEDTPQSPTSPTPGAASADPTLVAAPGSGLESLVRVMVSPEQRTLAHIVTRPAAAYEPATLAGVAGRVVVDPTRVDLLRAPFEGRVVHLDARAVPRAPLPPDVPLVRLQPWSVPSRSEVVERSVVLSSPHPTLVRRRFVEEEDVVVANAPLLELQVIDPVWVEGIVYELDTWERDGAAVAVGAVATVARTTDPPAAATCTGVVVEVDPEPNPMMHHVRVRLQVANPNGALLPGDDVRFDVARPSEAAYAVVPATAVVQAPGAAHVWIEVEPDVFEARLVVLGPAVEGPGEAGYLVVLDVEPGERLVTHGTFLVDSQATLERPEAMRQLREGNHPMHRLGGLMPQPGAYVGARTVCPVTLERFTVLTDSPSVEVDEMPIYFACTAEEDCAARFRADPERFLARTRTLGEEGRALALRELGRQREGSP